MMEDKLELLKSKFSVNFVESNMDLFTINRDVDYKAMGLCFFARYIREKFNIYLLQLLTDITKNKINVLETYFQLFPEDINCKYISYFTPLMYISLSKHVPIEVFEIFFYNPKLNIDNEAMDYKFNFFHFLCRNEINISSEIFELCLNQKIILNDRNIEEILNMKNLDKINLILKHIDINSKFKNNYTIIHYICKNNKIDILNLLFTEITQ